MILKVWQKILSNLEDRRAATVLTSIDYAKAFNRLSFQHCLKAFAGKGASTQIVSLLATFLTGRSMKVRVGSSWSEPRAVTRGCPQGSILGVFLFNVTTDDLEDSSEYSSSPGSAVPELAGLQGLHKDAGDGGESDLEQEALDAPADKQDELAYPDLRPTDEELMQDELEDHRALLGLLDDSEDDSFHSARSTQSHPLCTSSPASTCSPGGDNDWPSALDSPFPGGRRADCRRVAYSSKEDITSPPEPTSTCLGPWVRELVDVDKYVDDNLQEEKVSMENAERAITNSTEVRTKQAMATQNVFRHVVRAAEKKGMRVNAAKTNMICVSDTFNFEASAFILDRDGVRVESTSKMKVLGWHFSSRPTPTAYIEVLKRRFRERYWTLRHLKHNGFTNEDLVRVYKSIVRPVADYMMEVYHSMITDRQDEEVERLQTHALWCIFSLGLSGRRMREMAGLSTLRERRIAACDKFAEKAASSDRFGHWFPLRSGRTSSRRGEKYVEEYARCNRLLNSPLFYMRRRLNGKEGRSYGSRNKEFRED